MRVHQDHCNFRYRVKQYCISLHQQILLIHPLCTLESAAFMIDEHVANNN